VAPPNQLKINVCPAPELVSKMDSLPDKSLHGNSWPRVRSAGEIYFARRCYQIQLKLKNNKQPTILLAATTWWPLSAKLAVSLIRHGCSVEALCPPGHSLRYVSGVRRYHLYRRIGSLNALKRAVVAACPEVVIPCDDGVVSQLHQLYLERPELRALITRSLGTATHFEVVANRERLQQVARAMHIRVPRNKRVTTTDELRDWFERTGDTAVLKQNGTWGGNGVRVVRSLTEAADELTRMLEPAPWTTAWKRMLVNRDPLALWGRRHGKAPVVTLQEFIRGRPANIMMACWKGQVLGAVTVEVLWSQEETGAAMVVRLIDHHEIAQAACALAARLELSGFYGLDFMLDSDSGAAYMIELNPRCTQLGHIPIAGQDDLAGQLCRKLGMVSAKTADRSRPPGLTIGETIAFFPKASLWNPKSRYVCEGYLDMPQEEPALMREMLKEEWPNRQWQARLYHWIRPPRRLQPVAFDEPPTLGDDED
jgi:ATP-grasp domain